MGRRKRKEERGNECTKNEHGYAKGRTFSISWNTSNSRSTTDPPSSFELVPLASLALLPPSCAPSSSSSQHRSMSAADRGPIRNRNVCHAHGWADTMWGRHVRISRGERPTSISAQSQNRPAITLATNDVSALCNHPEPEPEPELEGEEEEAPSSRCEALLLSLLLSRTSRNRDRTSRSTMPSKRARR